MHCIVYLKNIWSIYVSKWNTRLFLQFSSFFSSQSRKSILYQISIITNVRLFLYALVIHFCSNNTMIRVRKGAALHILCYFVVLYRYHMIFKKRVDKQSNFIHFVVHTHSRQFLNVIYYHYHWRLPRAFSTMCCYYCSRLDEHSFYVFAL